VTRAVSFAALVRAAAELAADGEDADAIAADLLRRFPSTTYAHAIKAADRAAARRTA